MTHSFEDNPIRVERFFTAVLHAAWMIKSGNFPCQIPSAQVSLLDSQGVKRYLLWQQTFV
jgi:hypothetical protein